MADAAASNETKAKLEGIMNDFNSFDSDMKIGTRVGGARLGVRRGRGL
jgi:hypothetical protein